MPRRPRIVPVLLRSISGKRMRCSIFLVSCAVLVFSSAAPGAAIAAGSSVPGPTCPGLSQGPTRTVTRIVDGETVALDDGSELRLIGALAPRAMDVGADPGSWEVENRTRDALRALVLGKSIALGFGGERLDRYGRLQAHAYLIEADQRRWVQGHLLERGLARAYVLADNRACAGELLASERPAREGRRGLWAEAAYQVRQASRPIELHRYLSTFQVVEGRIARVAVVRGIIYLNFNRDWRRGFSASLKNGDRAALAGFAADPKLAEGRNVRVRGWIEGRRRLVIDLSTSGQIELLEDGATYPKSR